MGLSQRAAAKRGSFAHQLLVEIEAGKKKFVLPATAQKVARALECVAAELQ